MTGSVGTGTRKMANLPVGPTMSKILLLLILAMMIVHLIKPLGLPGLKRRGDFWKLALIALAAVSLTILLRGD